MLHKVREPSGRSRLSAWSLPLCLGLLIGCSSEEQPIPQASTGPLTIAEWKELPPEVKFEEEGLQRLREGTPELQDEAAFQKFQETVFKEELQKDAPLKPAGSY
ncbi:MAG: hypothetical protein ACE37I_02365 [Rubinisphaera brasiliensis]|uniref:hypothetical protein n=1 Tax=Rubinisphaera brasiliensis TaxID=119 RepID=UPI00391D3697